MFTGLVQKTGKIRRVSYAGGLVVEIAFSPWPAPLEKGESVAVDGVCLTVADFDRAHFTAHVLDETARRTTLADARPGRIVNLERAVRAGESLGGHIVQGHVETCGEIVAKTPKGRDFALKIKVGPVAAAECVLKGSVAIDGVSLTISGLGADWLQVDIIPTTAAETTLGAKRVGERVNIETDVLTRRAAAVAKSDPPKSRLTMEFLAENGFL